MKPLTVKKADKETLAFEAIPLNESFLTTVYVALLAIAGAATTTGTFFVGTATSTAVSGSLMTCPGKITLLDLKPLTLSKSLNFTFALLAIPVKESFRTTTYVNPAVAVADDELDDFDDFAFDSARAPGTPTTPSMIAEHNDTASVLPNVLTLRFTGFCIGPVQKELE